MDTISALKEIGLGSRLKRLSESLMKEIQLIYHQQNIDFDPYLFPAFYKISACRSITNTELRESLLTSQPAVTQTINKLLSKGLVVLKDDKIDKRKKQILLSKKGQTMFKKLQPLWNIMDQTIKKYTHHPAKSFLEHIDNFEADLYSGKIVTEMNNKIAAHSNMNIESFKTEYSQAFYDLNIEWLETYFYVEDFDREVLANPDKYILSHGGYIFFAVENGLVLGTVALMKAEDGIFELTKMAVLPNQRGRRIGQKLMQYCIDFAKKHEFSKLFLYSNTKLENAIYIYRKYGFIEIPVEADSPYERSNIKMELPI